MVSFEIGSSYKVFLNKKNPLLFKLGKLINFDENCLKFIEYTVVEENEDIVHPTMFKLPCLLLDHNLCFSVGRNSSLKLIYVVHKNNYLNRELIFHEGFDDSFAISKEITPGSAMETFVSVDDFPVSSALAKYGSIDDHITDISYLISERNVDKCFSQFNFRSKFSEFIVAALLKTKGDGDILKRTIIVMLIFFIRT